MSRAARLAPVLAVACVLAGAAGANRCASIQAGHDRITVETQRFLGAADACYGSLMRFYFAPGVAAELGTAGPLFEAARTGYDAPYKGLQAALDAYRTGGPSGPIRSEMQRTIDVLAPAFDAVKRPGRVALSSTRASPTIEPLPVIPEVLR